MMRAIRKRLALGIAAALFISGLKVTATAEEAIADNAAQVSSVCSGDYSESENLPTVQENAEGEITAYAAEDATSGDFGASNGLHWEWDALTKTITISGDDNPSFDYSNPFLTDVEYIYFQNCTLRGSLSYLFAHLTHLKQIDVTELTMVDIVSTSGMFNGCSSLTSIDLSGLDTSNVTNMAVMFFGCSNLTSLDVSKFDTSNVTNMYGMFSGCSNLTSLDVSKFDTSNVTNMYGMFSGCSSLTSLDVSHFDTSNVTNMGEMFSGCSSLTSLDVSEFDTSNVTNMGEMFSGCSSLTTLDVSKFDTSNVTWMIYMFYNCSNLTGLNLSNFDTSNVTGMSGMFSNCSNLTTLDVSHFDTSNVRDIDSMFYNCSKLTSLDLSSFNVVNVNGESLGEWGSTDMDNMLWWCSSLTTLHTPCNIKLSVSLPTVPNTVWKLPDGTEMTELPQGLAYSVTLNRYDAETAPQIITTTQDLNMDDVVRVKYVPYSYTVLTNNADAENIVTFSVVEGELPEGLQMYPATGEIYGVPLEAGEFLIKVMASYSNPAYESSYAELMLTVLENTDENVGTSTDSGYEITERVLNFDRDTIAENSTQTLVSQGEYSQFRDVYIDGQKLTEGQDYTSASGSTRITIYNQTLGNVGTGTHTLGVEFRTEDGVLKRAAQNYIVSSTSGNDNPSGESGNNNPSGESGNGSTSVTDDGNSNTADNGQDGNAAHVTAEISADTSAEEEKEFIIYTVVRGDNLWKIATKYYGRGNDWKIIYEDNREIIRNPDLLYAGQQLRIRISGAGSTSASTAEVISTAGDGVSSYRVQKGESLWAIAHSVYGKGNLWKRIYEANKNVIADPEKIYGGQLLTIPQN